MAGPRPFWIILAGSTPTAFRSRHREDLLPTLHQLQRKQADVVLRWFDRGRVWESPEEARDALKAQRQEDRRPREWRPGGTHRDPRQRYELSRDQKRARFKQRQWVGPRDGPSAKPPSAYSDDKPDTGSGPRRDRFR